MKKILLLVLLGCGSAQKKEMAKVKDKDISSNFKQDFIVKDASSSTRPGWVVDAQLWAKKMKYDLEDYRYFSYETEPKVSREIACDLAKANARVDVASQISTYVKKSLGQTESGIVEAENIDNGLRSYFDRSLIEKIENVLVGSSVEKLHWEKRQYFEKKGASRDYIGYTCAAMVKVAKADIKSSMNQVRADMKNRGLKSDQKELLEKMIQKAESNYLNLRGL